MTGSFLEEPPAFLLLAGVGRQAEQSVGRRCRGRGPGGVEQDGG